MREGIIIILFFNSLINSPSAFPSWE